MKNLFYFHFFSSKTKYFTESGFWPTYLMFEIMLTQPWYY